MVKQSADTLPLQCVPLLLATALLLSCSLVCFFLHIPVCITWQVACVSVRLLLVPSLSVMIMSYPRPTCAMARAVRILLAVRFVGSCRPTAAQVSPVSCLNMQLCAAVQCKGVTSTLFPYALLWASGQGLAHMLARLWQSVRLEAGGSGRPGTECVEYMCQQHMAPTRPARHVPQLEGVWCASRLAATTTDCEPRI